MSSWIPSLFNPPSSDEDNPTSPTPRSPSAGVKEDLSSVFRGVAAFLTPALAASSSTSSDTITGIKHDLAEIQGTFKSGLSLISSKITSNFLQFHRDENYDDDDVSEEEDEVGINEEEEDVVGINEEVVEFVRKISGRMELWTDFPISLPDDIVLSDHQRKHAAGIDHLVPELVTLRQKICSQISDGKFWVIYFILLFPRLDEEDLMLLSTPQVFSARETLMKKLQTKSDVAQESTGKPEPSDYDEDTDENTGKGYNMEGGEGTSQYKDNETVNVPKLGDSANKMESRYHSELVDTSSKQSDNTDYSLSDLEDIENDLPGVKGSKGVKVSQYMVNKSSLREKESEGEDSSGWLTVDDTDFDSLSEN